MDAVGGDPKARFPVPAPAAQEQAIEKVRDVFQRDYAASARGVQKSDLARQLLEQAEKTADALDRWALLSESARLAIEAGDTDLAFTAVESMWRDYQVDRTQVAADVLGRLSKKVPSTASGGFVRRCLELVRDLHGTQSDAVDTQKILALAAASAKKTGDLDLQAEVSRVIHRDKERQRAAREIKTLRARVEAEPNDADLNLQLGRLLCLKWCDWRTGVGFVEKGGDQALASLARAEAAGVAKADTQGALADAWWSWAESQRSPWKQLGLARAAVHYAEVLNDREGLDRARVENRLAEAMEAGGGTGEQAFLADIKESAVAGAANGFTKNGTFNGIAFTCRGKPYPKSVFAHPSDGGTAKVAFRMPPGVRRLRGSVGIFSLATAPPSQQPGSAITFRAVVDGEPVWVSPPLSKRDQAVVFDVDLRGSRVLELQTSSMGSANMGWGAWLDPVIIK
jgi:hypothetical protein